MKFHVSRTSQWDHEEPPCAEAFRDTYTRIDTRTTDDPAKITAHRKKSTAWWYNNGTNHRVENGQIKRDFPGESQWAIELSDLDALIAFMHRYGSLVIETHWDNPGTVELEIYDNYRE